MARVRFLHVVKDDKFFHPVMNLFSGCEEIESKCIIYNPTREAFSFIKENDGVDVYTKADDFVKRLNLLNYDVLYLHSLQPFFYKFIKDIPKNIILIWWAWGYDIYGQQILGLDSFINTNFYGKKTQQLRMHVSLLMRIKRVYAKMILAPQFAKGRKQIISRVDYFQPVCSIDYELMKRYAGLKSKVFYNPGWGNFYTGNESVRDLDAGGSILIGNSAEYVQNHLDIWDCIKKSISPEREIIVPLSYGNKYYAAQVKRNMSEDNYNFNFLETFLPGDEYFRIFNRCSYAIFGNIRQHAMGNIYNALLHGLKVFLYKDSFVYKYLLDIGCVVYSIDDIAKDAFILPLSAKEQQQNFEALNKEQRNYRSIGNSVIKEILNIINNREENGDDC